jgi:hypothetical protein
MKLLLLLALAFPLGCLALLSLLGFLGVLTLAGALHVVSTIRARLNKAWRGSVGSVQSKELVRRRALFTKPSTGKTP